MFYTYKFPTGQVFHGLLCGGAPEFHTFFSWEQTCHIDVFPIGVTEKQDFFGCGYVESVARLVVNRDICLFLRALEGWVALEAEG